MASAVLMLNVVCTGNICRSPTGEVMLRDKLTAAGFGALVTVVSCGTHGHEGWSADDRSVTHASRRGYDLRAHRGRRLASEDYDTCALLLALDSGHLEHLQRKKPVQCPPAALRLIMEYAAGTSGLPADVPDPYYEAAPEFEKVLDMLDRCTDGLVVAVGYALTTPDPARTLLQPASELRALAEKRRGGGPQ
jgi:protein-tyrosine phosphatase